MIKNTIKKIIDFFIKNYNFKFSNLSKKIENMITYSDFDHLKKLNKKMVLLKQLIIIFLTKEQRGNG